MGRFVLRVVGVDVGMSVIDAYETEALQLADRFFGAIENNDTRTVEQIYAPDAIIWHNYDPLDARENAQLGQSVPENIAFLTALPQAISGLKYEVWQQAPTATGFVRQHIVRGTTPDGYELSIPVCVVAEIRAGKISKFYEYLSLTHLPASLAEFLG